MPQLNHQTVQLSAGRHPTPENGMCVMELTSVLAGEPFSDRPHSVSETVAGLLRGYNDGLDHERRQTLKRFAAASVGTAAGRAGERRRRRLLRASFPAAEPAGSLAWYRWRAAVDPYQPSLELARHVAATGDAALHARVIALIDELIDMDRSGTADWGGSVVADADAAGTRAPAAMSR